MKDDVMGYARLAQEALRGVVPLVLRRLQEEGAAPGDHEIYLRFRTRAEGVVLPEHLLEQYPDEITIVLRKHFWDLEVEDDHFSVGLSFNQRPESLRVPYRAIVQLYDPTVRFLVTFPDSLPNVVPNAEPAVRLAPEPESSPPSLAVPEPDRPQDTTSADDDADVVSLDAFRKK